MMPHDMEVKAIQSRLDLLAQELTKLRAIEEIRQLKYRYFRAMDMADMALLRTVLISTCAAANGSFAGPTATISSPR
jgi:hypothetical protein